MEPGTLIGLLIAAAVAFWVAYDAAALRREEVARFGKSSILPPLWGFGVFMLLIVFLPWYLISRSSHKKRLMAKCPYCASAVSRDATVCPYCSSDLRRSDETPSQAPLPPPPPVAVAVPAGWLADPSGGHELRYWDGREWTAHVSDSGEQSMDLGA